MAAAKNGVEKHQMHNLIHGEFHKQTIPRSPAQSFGQEKRHFTLANGHGAAHKGNRVGPGHYKAEAKGIEDHGPTKSRNPQYRFGTGQRRHTAEANAHGGRMNASKVGPGQYYTHATSIDDQSPTQSKSPQYGFGTAERRHHSSCPAGNPSAPHKPNRTGPGEYSPNFEKVAPRAPGFGFGPPPRPACAKSQAPGPGRYL
mmetsp:Transcript_115218/g.311418  ORF Transcript_115218/g.311418 Transcript_115218/m.311418 type:complete len:200 (+) Transcript_115218:78-677(+)